MNAVKGDMIDVMIATVRENDCVEGNDGMKGSMCFNIHAVNGKGVMGRGRFKQKWVSQCKVKNDK